ncbi:MAG TPA: helix-turn-helix transcriptional regulator [Solirubrobacteraceae bacterium]|nr:helix-turn-helix transcriptional regulator [Solirubrobacteraceae bacterium]
MPASIPLTTKNDGARPLREIAASGKLRREELADFLRMRRAALQPADVGLPGGGRRRTPGLRREEVAQLAGVGSTWYTWLEQGRDVRASVEVLEALAQALRLDQAERTHLILLGRGEAAPPCKSPAERISPTLRRLIEGLGPNPAYVLGRRWDYLAWNDAAIALLGDFGELPRAARNHAWQTFTDPARREMFVDWEHSSRTMVAKFRADSARHIGDPEFESLIRALRKSSPEFAKAWERHEVSTRSEGRKDLRHPVAGLMSFSHAVFHPAEKLEQRLILYSPLPENDTAEKLAALMSGRTIAGPPELAAPARAKARRAPAVTA